MQAAALNAFTDATTERTARVFYQRPLAPNAPYVDCPWIVQCWGHGHWCIANGGYNRAATEEVANRIAKTWIETGIQPAYQELAA